MMSGLSFNRYRAVEDFMSITDSDQALNGLHFLISQQLVHTGLKLENILVTHDGVVKIGKLSGPGSGHSMLMLI